MWYIYYYKFIIIIIFKVLSILKCHLYLMEHYYSMITTAFSITCNMLIYCSRNISFYYQS